MPKYQPVLDLNESMQCPELQEALAGIKELADPLVAPLEAADFVIADVGFERKSWSDYAASMQDGRLDEQVQKLGEYEYAYILVSDDMVDAGANEHSGMKASSIRGHMASLTVREEYPVEAVIPCSTIALVADYGARLARKHTSDPKSTYIPTGIVAADEAAGKQMWGCIEGVGPELAERLYEEFDSPTRFTAEHYMEGVPTDVLEGVEGIGEKRARHIWEVLYDS